MDKFKIFWGHTTAIGAAYYRMMSFALEAKRLGIADCNYIDYDPKRMGNIPNMWERELLQKEETRIAVVEQLNAMVRYADIALYQYFLTPLGLAVLRMQQGEYNKPILMELDDYPFDLPSFNACAGQYDPEDQKTKVIKQQLGISDGVITTNEYLANKFKAYNKNVYVIPNTIDFEIWDKALDKKKCKPNKIRIGHIGAGGHVDDRHLLKETVLHILDKYENVEFCFVGDPVIPLWLKEPVDQGRVKIVSHWKNIDDYPEYAASFGFDIALAPLRDYEFNRCKSNLRYLEYSALKIPTVASSVENYKNTIEDGVDGFLCRDTKDWTASLELLIEDKVKRQEVAEAANKKVRKDYNLKLWTPKYIDLLKKIKEEHSEKV